MLTTIKDLGVSLIASGALTLIIYAALDHLTFLDNFPKLTKFLKTVLFLSALAGVAYQYSTTKAARIQADLDREKNRQEVEGLRQEIRSTREENVRLAGESQEKIAEARASLARAVTEAKMSALQTDFDAWADDFGTNQEARTRFRKDRRDLLDAKAQAADDLRRQNEATISKANTLSYPMFSYTIRFVEEYALAYATKAGKHVIVETNSLPDNLLDPSINRRVVFPSKAAWSMQTNFNTDNKVPCLIISFTDFSGNSSGSLTECVWNDRNIISMGYQTGASSPSPSDLSDECPLTNCDACLKKSLQKLLRLQIFQTEE
jgi:hypothetical protein